MRSFLTFIAGLGVLTLVLASTVSAQPTIVGYQGSLFKSGAAWNGPAEFKFAILCGGQIVWSNENTSGTEPATSVNIVVDRGVFSVLLGDPSLGMPAVTSGIMNGCATPGLRVWVDTGEGFDQLSDQAIGSGAFALHSDTANTAQSGSGTGDGHSLDAADGSPVNVVFVDAAGRVGIGTTTPQHDLDMEGSTFEIGSAKLSDGSPAGIAILSSSDGVNTDIFPAQDTAGAVRIRDVNSTGLLRIENAGATYVQSYSENNVTPSSLILQAGGGNVGLGVENIRSLFHVAGSGFEGGSGIFESLDSGNSLTVQGVDGPGVNDVAFLSFDDGSGRDKNFIGLTGQVAGPGELRMALGGLERMRIDSSGNIGIGITAPSQKLDVGSGNVLIRGADNFNAPGHEAILSLGDNFNFIKSVFGGGVRIGTFGVSESAIAIAPGTGNVGIGTETPQALLEVAGEIKTSVGVRLPDGNLLTAVPTGGSSAWGGNNPGTAGHAGPVEIGWGTNLPAQLEISGFLGGTLHFDHERILHTPVFGNPLTIETTDDLVMNANQVAVNSSQVDFNSQADFNSQVDINDSDLRVTEGGSLRTRIGSDLATSDGIVEVLQASGSPGAKLRGPTLTLHDSAGTPTVEIYGGGAPNTGYVLTPTLTITGGADVSEAFAISDASLEPGMVVSIDPRNPGELMVSHDEYDSKVAGIISGAGGVRPGLTMGQEGTIASGEHPVALTGRVYCWVDAKYGPVEPGTLLTTSGTPGHARRVSHPTRAQGAILGKAMTSLDEGRGLVLVLVALQ